ncbi:MAG: lipopolysaccharide transport periplasmic protein LptA [Desulfuromonadaceae bacterium]
MKLAYICIVLFCVWFPVSASSAPPAAASKSRSSLPITVKSNEMNADNVANRAVFTGKVVAKQGDVTIFSDKLVVSYADKGGDVEKIEAFGTVRIVQQNRTGFSDQAVYESSTGRIVMTGSPRVVQGDDSISGKIITYYVDDEKSYVTSDGDPKARVEAVINPAARKKDAGKP